MLGYAKKKKNQIVSTSNADLVHYRYSKLLQVLRKNNARQYHMMNIPVNFYVKCMCANKIEKRNEDVLKV